MTRAHPLLMLGAGAALACGALFLMSQAGGPASYGSWGPPKKGVVHLVEGYGTAPGGGAPIAQLPVGVQEYVVYTVPPDRWLTVTAAEIYAMRFSNNSWTPVQLLWGEKFGGNFTQRGWADGQPLASSNVLTSGTPVASPALFPPPVTGWVFRPGSEVVVRRAPGDPFINQAVSIFQLALSGYTTRD